MPVTKRQGQSQKAARDKGVIELEIDRIAMRVGRGADAKTVAAVIRALKARRDRTDGSGQGPGGDEAGGLLHYVERRIMRSPGRLHKNIRA